MTKSQRKNQLKGRLAYSTAIIGILGISVFTFAKSTKTETYAIASENTNGMHYKYVTEYHLNSIYIGKNTFIDENGNEWKVQDNEYNKGKQYTLIMHDNGTENNIKDDVIVDIY